MRPTFPLLVAAALVVALPVPAAAEKQELRFTFSGADAGSNTFERQPDGSFTSVTDLSLAGMKIASKLTGRIVNGLLTEYELDQSQPGMSLKASVRGGKAVLEANGKKNEHTYTPGKVLFANFHPALSASLASAEAPGAAGSQKVDVLLVDIGSTLPVDLERQQARTVQVGGVAQVVQVLKVRFSTVDFSLYVTQDGRTVAWDVPTQMLKAVAPGYDDLIVDPTTRMPELSQPTLKTVTEKAVKVRMRDGADLVADLVRPEGPGKFPAILVRTPYGRASEAARGEWWARRGYVYISEDCRGRGDSGGEWEPFVHERKDGYDTIDWISKQPWSSGSVGMIGGSYSAWVQWWAAVEGHPALKCIVPQVSPPDPFYNMPIDHGIPFIYGGVWWAAVVKEKGQVTSLPKLENLDGFKTLPISKIDDAILGKDVPFVDSWWQKGTASAFGPANFEADLKKVKIPALHISGWWDGDGIGTKRNWAAMRSLGRTNQWLVYGPWTHFFNTTSRLGDTDYGPNAIIDLDSVYLRWFDTWLKGKQVGLEKLPKVRAFATGANRWCDLDGWPDSRSTDKTLYLSSAGPANGPQSVGELTDGPALAQDPDRYTYNPAHATVPKDLGSLDVSAASTVVKLEDKDQDTLLYRTAPLGKPLTIGGPIGVDLYVSSSAVDTDFYADLVDVGEKGEIRAIGRGGKLRASYRNGFDKPAPLLPGKVYKLTLEHWDIAHTFKPGHRVGLLITSDGFPLYARNLGTGEPPATGTRMVAQSQALFHDAAHPSAVRFRVLPEP